MTTIAKTTTKYGTDCIKVNGRARFDMARIETIEKGERSYEWNGKTTNGWEFQVWGGKQAGGRSNEWFADFLGMSIRCNSAVDALKTICNA